MSRKNANQREYGRELKVSGGAQGAQEFLPPHSQHYLLQRYFYNHRFQF